MVGLVLIGAAIGLFYNYLGLQSSPRWGIAWVGVDRIAELENAPVIGGGDSGVAPGVNPDITTNDDPLAAIGLPSAALPEIPDIGRYVKIELGALKQYWDADGALIVDAREDFEFAEGHIPGAVSMPYATASTDPLAMESLETGGRPIIVYCGGGSCELSILMAEELLFSGHPRVAVYAGGYPEWVEAGYPVEEGS